MDAFIEVTGQATLMEKVVEYRADLTLRVNATKLGALFSDAGTLREKCIRTLLAAGLTAGELSEGGAAAAEPWFWKKKAGEDASYKILITCGDALRMYRAINALEPVFGNARHALFVQMLAPKFEATAENRAAAQARALADARAKAVVIAREAGITLASVVQVEELMPAMTRSGAFGDQDWADVGLSAADVEEPNDTELDDPSRENRIRYRVRFAIAGNSPI